MATLTISCEYFTRPAAKKEYKKVSVYTRTEECQKKLDEYSGSAEVSGSYAGVSASVKGTWANSHSNFLSKIVTGEEVTESSVEYYEGITLLIRTLKYDYKVDEHEARHTEEIIVQKANKEYSTEELFDEAEKYMKKTFEVNMRNITIPLILKKKEIYYKWVPKSRNNPLPDNAVYAGNTGRDGLIYVARFDNVPGKVNLSDGKNIYNFWVQGKGSRTSGEVLITNGECKWIDIKRGDPIPEYAIYSGLDQCKDEVWVGRSICGECGKINVKDNGSVNKENGSSNSTMWNLWSHFKGQSAIGSILTIPNRKYLV